MRLPPRRLTRVLALGAALAAGIGLQPSPSGAQVPAASPRIGTLYQGGVSNGAWGITAFTQHANGSLTTLGHASTEGLLPESSAVVHLKSGKALYVLAGLGGADYIFSFHIGALGQLTPFAKPATANLGPNAAKLAAYDPLSAGTKATPLLVTGACAKSSSDPTYCGAAIGTFAVNPVTGILGPEKVGVVQSNSATQMEGGPEMNAAGQLAFTVQLRPLVGGWSYEMFFERIKVVAGTSVLVAVTGRTFSYVTSGTVNPIQLYGEPIVTSAHYVQIDASNLPGGKSGWLSAPFGSPTAAALSSSNSTSGGPTGAANVESQSFVLAAGTTSSTGACRFNVYGKTAPGLGAVYHTVPCSGPNASITAAIDLHGFIYVGRYGQPTLLFRDLGAKGIGMLPGSMIPAGTIQAYSFSGF